MEIGARPGWVQASTRTGEAATIGKALFGWLSRKKAANGRDDLP